MMRKLTASVGFAASALAVPAPIQTTCDLSFLQNATDAYIGAQVAGKPSNFITSGSSTEYTENFKTADFTKGIVSQALKVDHNHSIYDKTECLSYTELIITDSNHPSVTGTQIRVVDGAVSHIDTLVTDKGDWLFNVTGTLHWASQEHWDEIPIEKRDSRQVIRAAADAYADIFNNKSVVVPWGQPCARLEGGSYTGNGSPSDRCDVGIPTGVNNTNRRYVIDEATGSVDLFMTFANSLPDSHEFRVEGGKIRYVHTLTVMGS
ncbi:hypothetical protein BKA67DRAFT_670592 [Truncatella angustata]|uniref:DUF8021 domain-containing protein n=1 Tax=Truncatella angustata TaxID=152316 RepID=A0A9P8RKQ0_9PEZI|nr:uncharacterized protein BKA67DRAFT_670592 [Truncatella angustata]KAH6645060.1 hypothetical protein BKA67DRAFT_670592 [Truncatella angustata]